MPVVEAKRKAKEFWGFRVSAEDLAEIKRRARARKLSTTAYVVQCALGELDADESTLDERFGRLEDRIAQLEHLAGLGGLG